MSPLSLSSVGASDTFELSLPPSPSPVTDLSLSLYASCPLACRPKNSCQIIFTCREHVFFTSDGPAYRVPRSFSKCSGCGSCRSHCNATPRHLPRNGNATLYLNNWTAQARGGQAGAASVFHLFLPATPYPRRHPHSSGTLRRGPRSAQKAERQPPFNRGRHAPAQHRHHCARPRRFSQSRSRARRPACKCSSGSHVSSSGAYPRHRMRYRVAPAVRRSPTMRSGSKVRSWSTSAAEYAAGRVSLA